MKTPLKTEEVSSLQDLERFAVKLVAELPPKALILLSGPMGAGKTKLVETIVRVLGGTDVSSPTFALHQTYQIGGKSIHHFDLYRLESQDEVASVGFWDVLQEPKGWIFVEWPERLGLGAWPVGLPVYLLQIDILGQDARNIKWEIQS
jgi:tRNA threonylcarbamoyladenosine biosynthesis protein TsaE